MKTTMLLAAVLGALAVASGSAAAPPVPQQDGFAGTHEAAFAVKRLSQGEARKLGVPEALLPGKQVDARATTPLTDALGPCGACIQTCWVTTFHTGDSTSTGSYWENDSPVWCGNGSWITYADVSRHWQSVSIWYSADGEAGPWFDGGCVGCVSIHFTVYGYFSWHPPVWPVSHTTVRLGVWMQAYRAAAYAGRGAPVLKRHHDGADARPHARGVRDGLRRLVRGFLFGFSAAVGACVAIVLLSILALLLLRPFG